MSRKITFVLVVSLLITVPVFAQFDTSTVNSISNNDFYVESIRLTGLAQETFESGDYDASTSFAEEAIRYAQLSNEFIADQLIGEAGLLLDWANSNNFANIYPYDYNESRFYFETGVIAQTSGDWEMAIVSAIKSIEILAMLEEGGSGIESGSGIEGGSGILPGQYTVRTWAVFRDCLWNIAGYSWVYGDPEKWRVLYEANRSKMPEPNNPDLIEPGMVLEIPSISGEARQGMWDPNQSR